MLKILHGIVSLISSQLYVPFCQSVTSRITDAVNLIDDAIRKSVPCKQNTTEEKRVYLLFDIIIHELKSIKNMNDIINDITPLIRVIQVVGLSTSSNQTSKNLFHVLCTILQSIVIDASILTSSCLDFTKHNQQSNIILGKVKLIV